MSLASNVFDLFSEPSSFARDAYGYVTNQLGHGWLGNAITSWVIWTAAAFGDYPDQTVMLSYCILFYLVVWEWGFQGWRGMDTVADTLFFAFGASLFFVLDMSQIINISSKYEALEHWRTIDILSAFHLCAVIFLIPGVLIRLKRGRH